MEKTAKHKAGRPTLYRPDYAEQARRLCLVGCTNEELAKAFDVSLRTVEQWIADIDEFSRSVKDGRHSADSAVANSLYDKAISGDTTACIFWLKNRRSAQWRDRHEHTGADGGPIKLDFPAPAKVFDKI